jgi:hypothetical protein
MKVKEIMSSPAETIDAEAMITKAASSLRDTLRYRKFQNTQIYEKSCLFSENFGKNFDLLT